MERYEGGIRLTHIRTGFVVQIGYRRSWIATLKVAERILAARVHAHDKGLLRILELDPEFEVGEVRGGEFAAVTTIDNQEYHVTYLPEKPECK